MKILDLIVKEMQERGIDAQRLHTGSQIIETTAQAKYNDTRRAEWNYISGVNKAKMRKHAELVENI